MAFPKFHGISLAQNGFIENLRVERLAADPVPAQAGRIWFNTTERKFKHSTLDELGAVIIRSFATEEDLVASIQAVSDRVATIEGDYVKKDGSVAFTGDVDAGSNKVVNVAAPVADTDAANKGYVDAGIAAVEQQVAALGAAFNYVGTLAGGVDEASAFDMDTLEVGTKDAGDYYKISTAGWFKVGAAGVPFYVNSKDGLLWNTAGAVDVIDNTNSEVQGTAGEIAVTGSVDTGFTVAVDEAFKTRVSDLEGETTSLQSELDASQVALGLNPDGTLKDWSAWTGASGIAGSADYFEAFMTVDDAMGLLVNAAGLGNSGLPFYQARTGSNYLDAATSLADESTLLDAALKAESDRAKAAEGDLAALTTEDKSSLVAAINEVDAAAGEGTAALKQSINAQRFTFTSVAPALQHAVVHNLNSGLVSVDVWTKGDDGLYRNDIVAVTLTDANTVTVDLTEARDVKVVVQALDNLA